MEAARRELERMRHSPDGWPDLRYERVTGDDGEESDRNAARRAQVLWALQYDRRPEDLPLVRWLAGQEAQCRREDPFQGLGPATGLAGFLLSEYRQLPDVWLHWEIKEANFDTSSGYDLEHLFAAGVAATVAFVRGSEHPGRDDVLELLLDERGEPWVSPERLAEWARLRRRGFPAEQAAEDPLVWVERAKLIGDRGLAREWLDSWAAGRPRDAGTLSTLRYELADLGAFAAAAAAQRESLAFVGDAWDAASAWQSLAGLERQAGRHDEAWAALRECRVALEDVANWPAVGLGRTYVQELFLLAGSADGELAGVVFAEADRQARDVPRLPLVVLQAAAETAGKVGAPTRVEHYRRLRDAEQRRLDENTTRFAS